MSFGAAPAEAALSSDDAALGAAVLRAVSDASPVSTESAALTAVLTEGRMAAAGSDVVNESPARTASWAEACAKAQPPANARASTTRVAPVAGAMVLSFIRYGCRIRGSGPLPPLGLASRAGIPTGGVEAPDTVAAQRRNLTVFPIYFLRLPAASREGKRGRCGPRSCVPIKAYVPARCKPFAAGEPQKSPGKGCPDGADATSPQLTSSGLKMPTATCRHLGLRQRVGACIIPP